MSTREKDISGAPTNGGRFAAKPNTPAAIELRGPTEFNAVVASLRAIDASRLPPLEDPRPGMMQDADAVGSPRWRGRIPINHLVTSRSAIVEVAKSGRTSESDIDYSPVELCRRDDSDAHFEIVDGHHRLVEALRRGETDIPVCIYDYTDDEPYEGDLYDFAALRDAIS